jgi:hypothetical protein
MARFYRLSLVSCAAVLLLADRVHSQSLPKRERARQDHQYDLSARGDGEVAQQSSLGAIWAAEGFELEAGAGLAGGLSGIAGWTGADAENEEEEVAAAEPTSLRLERRVNSKRGELLPCSLSPAFADALRMLATTTTKKTTTS